MEAFSIYDLERRINGRAGASGDVSYTRKLLDRGVAQCAKKLGEEAVELAIASVAESRERFIEEWPISSITCWSCSARDISSPKSRPSSPAVPANPASPKRPPAKAGRPARILPIGPA